MKKQKKKIKKEKIKNQRNTIKKIKIKYNKPKKYIIIKTKIK